LVNIFQSTTFGKVFAFGSNNCANLHLLR